MAVAVGCIEHGQASADGYGHSTYKGKEYRLHVIAQIKATGELPDGRWVLHSCDNPRCVNPAHLRWGSPADNSRDMVARSRHVPAVKLTPEQTAAVLRSKASGRELAAEYKVHRNTIQNMRKRAKLALSSGA